MGIARNFKNYVNYIFHKKQNSDNVNMNWDFLGPSDVEKLESENIIEEYENKVGYTFPEDFKSFMRQCNGAFLEKELFDVDIEEIGTTDFRTFSFNKDSSSSMWEFGEFDEMDDYFKKLAKKYICIADTSFGDFICYNIKNDKLYFFDHETLRKVKLANSFTEFSQMLYEDEE